MRTLAWVVALSIVPISAHAQDIEPEPAAEADAATEAEAEAEAATEAEADAAPATDTEAAADTDAPDASAPTRTLAPKVAVVVLGDPDALLVATALEIEARLTLAGTVRLPADPSLRAALHGDAGTADDGLEEVRRERRRLGLGEASDAPVLARLGRRAGAVLVIAVRAGAGGGPEAIGLDVRSAQFFEGALPLVDPDPDAIAPFVDRRARIAARGAAGGDVPGDTTDDGPEVVPPQAVTAEPSQDAGQWFEQNWPFFAAGGLLAAAIVFVVVTATASGPPPPMLRFQPGTP